MNDHERLRTGSFYFRDATDAAGQVLTSKQEKALMLSQLELAIQSFIDSEAQNKVSLVEILEKLSQMRTTFWSPEEPRSMNKSEFKTWLVATITVYVNRHLYGTKYENVHFSTKPAKAEANFMDKITAELDRILPD